MDQAFYTGAVGAHQQLRHLNVQGDNIANVNTFGFKANKARFINLMYRLDERTAEEPQRRSVGMRMLMTSNDFAQGSPADSGRPLDYVIEGKGFFALVDLQTGDVSYTRNGAFEMAELQVESDETDEDGQPIVESRWYLSDGKGRFVLDNRYNDYTDDSDARDHIIEVTDRFAEQPVGIFDFESYDGITDTDGTWFLPNNPKSGAVIVGEGKLIQGQVEMSNVDLAESLTKVIEAQRAYGLALKVVQTSDEIETTINNLRS